MGKKTNDKRKKNNRRKIYGKKIKKNSIRKKISLFG